MKQNKFLFGMILGAMAISAFGVSFATSTSLNFSPSTKRNAENSMTLSYGKPAFVDTATTTQKYKLSEFTVKGADDIASVSITVATGSVSATTDSAYEIYSDFLSSSSAEHKTAILAFKTLQTASAVSNYVRSNVTFDSSANSASDVNKQNIRISFNTGSAALESTVPEDDAISTLIDSDGNTHFYIFDNKAYDSTHGTTTKGSNWEEAYNYAKTLKLFGMKGYLATITSAAENAVMDSITTLQGWAGAECDTVTNPDADTVSGLGQSGSAGRKVKSNWQWVCGPEALSQTNQKLFDTSYYPGNTSSVWASNEPNGYGDGTEWTLVIHYNKLWNDYKGDETSRGGSYTSAGAFIEFSPYPTSSAISFTTDYPSGNWKSWTQSAEAGFATYGVAARATNNGSGSESWTTIPYLPQPSNDILNVPGTFWTETEYTPSTTSTNGTVTYTASGNHAETENAEETAYSFSISKTLMMLVTADSTSTTLLKGLTAGDLYKITFTDGTSVTITADSNGQFNLGTYQSGAYLGKTLSTMVMVDSAGTVISETQTLPATVVRQQYDAPTPSVSYGDNDTVIISSLTPGHTYKVAGNTYVAGSDGKITISDLISSTATSNEIVDVSQDTTHYIDSVANTFLVAAHVAAPDASAYPVTEAADEDSKAQVAVPAGSEYYDSASNSWVKGATTVSVTPGQKVKVRVSATGTAPASEAIEISTKVFKQPTPAATIDYKAGMFHGLTANATYIIDGKEYTADANGDLEIDIPLYGHTFNLIKKHVHSDGSDEDSDPQSLTAIAMPDAPAASNYPVTEATSASEKASVVIPAGSEYKDPTTGKWIKGATTALVTPGTSIEVRVSGTTTSPFSHNTTISTKAYQWPTPTASVDYTNEKLTGFIANGAYTINGTSYTADADGNIAMDETWYGSNLSIIKSHVNSDGSDLDSLAESVTVSSRPVAPSDSDISKKDNDDGSDSVHVSDTQEYSLDGGKTWIKGTNNDVTVSGNNTVMVRTAATATTPAGAVTTVQGDPSRPYRSTTAIVCYCLFFLILLLLAYRFIIFARWHSKDKHSHLGFFVANNRWMNQILFHTPYNKVELQAQEAAKQAAENKQEGK
jgi:hypothetical protein